MSANTKTSAETPRIIVPRRHVDGRGWFSESYHEVRLRDHGIDCDFVQDNQSLSKRIGTLRGLHFQIPPMAQAKLISVLCGKILDVIVDIRHGSPTYGKHVSTELSASRGHQLYVPVGFAHGFITLEDEVLVMYKVSRHYSPAHDSGIRWNDPDIALQWPAKATDIVISDKARRLPLLKEFVSPFLYDGHPLAPLAVLELG
jgi:dTDP-4-dehydrorhamnose 3,5-epimerase